MNREEEKKMAGYWRDVLDKKPWLWDYYFPESGSRFMVLREEW